MGSFGGAFTGQNDDEEGPLRSIVSDSASALNKSLFGDPASRAALLQIGLNMMQPVGLGQTAGGHIASSIGAGGEAVTQLEKEELERRKAESEEDYKSRMAGAAETNASAYSKGQDLSKIDRAIELQRMKNEAAAARLGQKGHASQAQRIYEFIKGPYFDPKNVPPDIAPYLGKEEAEIEQMLQQKYGGTPAATSPENQQALEWARAHPDDPRAKRILERLGVQ